MKLTIIEVRAINLAYYEGMFGRFAAHADAEFDISLLPEQHVFHVAINGKNGDFEITHTCIADCGAKFEVIK